MTWLHTQEQWTFIHMVEYCNAGQIAYQYRVQKARAGHQLQLEDADALLQSHKVGNMSIVHARAASTAHNIGGKQPSMTYSTCATARQKKLSILPVTTAPVLNGMPCQATSITALLGCSDSPTLSINNGGGGGGGGHGADDPPQSQSLPRPLEVLHNT